MRSIVLAHEVDHDGWRQAVRGLIAAQVPPEQVTWSVEAPDDLFAADAAPPTDASAPAFSLSRHLVDLSQTVLQAREPARFALLYGLVWRATHGERAIAGDLADPSVARARQLAQNVARDTHKMRAFLRFREIDDGEGVRHLAWFEPEHYIVEANAGFFIRRFAAMRFSILTPYRTLHWDGTAPSFGPGARAADIPGDDAMAEYWETYFRSIFNPARLKRSAMLSEMPRKYWRNMPETAAIAELIREAPRRAEAMVAAGAS
ncbi:TIGR03915 family putative DNA repair protein, partial [Endobacter medicaginis]